MLLKCCTTYVSKFGKLSSGHRTEGSFHDNPKEGQSQNCSNYHTVVLISHTNKVMLKILQFRLQQYMNRELPDVLQQIAPFVVLLGLGSLEKDS